MIGRKVFENQQGVAVLGQVGHSLLVFGPVLLHEGVQGGFGRGAVLGLPSFAQALSEQNGLSRAGRPHSLRA